MPSRSLNLEAFFVKKKRGGVISVEKIKNLLRDPFAKAAAGFLAVTGGGTVIWSGFLFWYFHASARQIFTLSLWVAIIGLAAGAVLIWAIGGLFRRALQDFLDSMVLVAQGDLTRGAAFTGGGLFGRLAGAFNDMLGSVRQLVSGAAEAARNTQQASSHLATSLQQARQAIDQIAAAVQEITAGNQNQAEEIGRTAQTLQKVLDSLRAAAEQAEKAASFSEEARRTAATGGTSIGEAISRIDAIRSALEQVFHSVQKLHQSAGQIEALVRTIDDIAAQTNLLSLNAAIEAARAGEHGRGFAVVAEEVRKLADQSAEAARRIVEVLAEVQAGLEDSQTAMAGGQKEIAAAVDVAGRAREALNQIVRSVEETAGQAAQIAQATRREVEALHSVAESMETLASISQETLASSQEVSASAEEQTTTLQEISQSGEALADLAARLQQQIARFRV